MICWKCSVTNQLLCKRERNEQRPGSMCFSVRNFDRSQSVSQSIIRIFLILSLFQHAMRDKTINYTIYFYFVLFCSIRLAIHETLHSVSVLSKYQAIRCMECEYLRALVSFFVASTIDLKRKKINSNQPTN